MGLFVAFGGSNIALPFLLDMFRLPADMFELFLVANVITNFFFMALSAMNLVVLTLLAMFLIKGRTRPRPAIVAALLVLLLVGAPLLLKGTGVLIDRFIPYEYGGYQDFVSRGLPAGSVQTRNADYDPDLPAQVPAGRLARIRDSGWLRVGHSSDALPWAFRNEHGETVGYDMELLHRLAANLGVGLEILRVAPAQVGHALASGQIDIYASGLMIDAGLLREFSVSRPYARVTFGLLVQDHRREEFESGERVRQRRDSAIGVLQSPLLLDALGMYLPDMKLVPVQSPREFLRGELPDIDALVMPAEAASAWTLVYPSYSAVVPASADLTIPVVFALPEADRDFRIYVDTWIQAAEALGVMDTAYQHWILGRDAEGRKRRWSVAHDVLHWTD